MDDYTPEELYKYKLLQVFASTYNLYQKTWQYHWNVTGPFFYTYHLLLDTIYNELIEATDTIAESCRAALLRPTTAPDIITSLSVVPTPTIDDLSKAPLDMIQDLYMDNLTILSLLDDAADAAEVVDDQAVMNLLADRAQAHKKNIYFLRSVIS